MGAFKLGRFGVGATIVLLVCQANATLGATQAYWRFEEGPADAPVPKNGIPNGGFYAGVADSSGNGNDLSAWSEGGFAGYAYRSSVPAAAVAQTGAANNFSVQNTGGVPGMFTAPGAAIQTISPAAFTIEVSFMPEDANHHRTLVGRDSRGTATVNGDLAALYLQILPDEAFAIKFCDVSGFWHEAVSVPAIIQGFPFPDVSAGRWYNAAAVSNGSTLKLYLDDVKAGTGYQLVAETDLTLSGSPNTALTAGAGSGSDWQAGTWTVGRGIYGGGHGDRAYGFIDEVRISDSALGVDEFLFVPEPSTLAMVALLGAACIRRSKR